MLFFSTVTFSLDNISCPSEITDIIHQPPPKFKDSDLEKINISADQTRSDNQGNSIFQGHVVIEKNKLRISADEVRFNQKSETININGNVHVDTDNMAIEADLGNLSKEKQSTYFKGIKFQVGKNIMRGTADSISSSKETTSELINTSITSCDLKDPGWLLSADSIILDHEEEYGSADDVVLRFMDVPFIYIPYMEFPIGDRRRSGLLVPEIEYSSSRGIEITVPWYWNIAPNHDAILAPHIIGHHGTQLDTQYRFLTETSEGQMDLAYLPNDKITDESRHQFRFKQFTDFTPDLVMDIDIQDVSDIEYFNDFSNNLSTSSTTHLSRDVKLSFNKQYWQSHLLAQTFETIDPRILPRNRPYRRLPQLSIQGDQPVTDNGLSFTFSSEWVAFDHETDNRDIGSRLQIKPGFHWLSEGSFWFFNPAIKFSHTSYDVEDAAGNQKLIEDRDIPISSLDTGIFFERELDNDLIQTLEPRIYYLNVPYQDQSLTSIFDTGETPFSSASLFRENRFTGGDLIGDANQVTLAVSSRLIDPETGNEYLKASVGQITYFDDRLVLLPPDTTIKTDHKSDIIGEITTRVENWSLSASTQWNSNIKQSQRDNFLLHYQSSSKHIFNLGLRNDRRTKNITRQTDLSIITPITSNVSFFGRWNYSLEKDRDLEVIGGFSYDSCCWSLQFMGQRYLKFSNNIEEYDNSFMIQLVFKGLGSISSGKFTDTLVHAIHGYKEDY